METKEAVKELMSDLSDRVAEFSDDMLSLKGRLQEIGYPYSISSIEDSFENLRESMANDFSDIEDYLAVQK